MRDDMIMYNTIVNWTQDSWMLGEAFIQQFTSDMIYTLYLIYHNNIILIWSHMGTSYISDLVFPPVINGQ